MTHKCHKKQISEYMIEILLKGDPWKAKSDHRWGYALGSGNRQEGQRLIQ